jgi:seryl-tRNA synthetase
MPSNLLPASDNVIANLRGEVQAQKALAKESQGLKKKIESQTSDIAALRQQVDQLTASLSEAQSQNKTLSTKLAANRTAAASVESATVPKVPGSAMKANGSIRMIGSAEAAQAAQAAQLKEDLYSDLTGLIVRSVKRETEEDVFDCIQTGRNGSESLIPVAILVPTVHIFRIVLTQEKALHFKLAAANEKAAESYDDAQCNYIPQLDPSRDRNLIELLPEYLVDDITFPRQQAAKFYARVVKALTEKPT